MVALIILNDITPGMTLAQDVQDTQGRILLRAGVELTERHIRIMKTWGVADADIKNISSQEAEDQSMAQLDPIALKKAEVKANKLFKQSNLNHPIVHELYRQWVIRYMQGKVLNNGL